MSFSTVNHNWGMGLACTEYLLPRATFAWFKNVRIATPGLEEITMKPLSLLKVNLKYVNSGVTVHLDVILASVSKPHVFDDTLEHH